MQVESIKKYCFTVTELEKIQKFYDTPQIAGDSVNWFNPLKPIS